MSKNKYWGGNKRSNLPTSQKAITSAFALLTPIQLQELTLEQLNLLTVPEYQYRANIIQSAKRVSLPRSGKNLKLPI